MKVVGKYSFQVGRDVVWTRLLEPDVLAGCIPGCQQFEEVGDDLYDVVLKVGIGAISGTYTGRVSVTERDQPASFKMLVEGKGRGGNIRGEGLLSLAEHKGQTELIVDGDAQVTGLIARVGQRLLGSASKMMMDQFFGCMKAKVESPG